MNFLEVWKLRLFDKNERRNYWAAEGHKVLLIAAWVATNIALFIEATYRWHNTVEGLNQKYGKTGWGYNWVTVARGPGQLLNFNCALVVLPVARTLLSFLRQTWLANYLPLDKNIIFHRFIAYFIVVLGIWHGSAHFFNLSCCKESYWIGTSGDITAHSTLQTAYGTKAFATGNFLYLTIVVMFSAAHIEYRRSRNFTVFWYVHHLFLVFFALVIAHAPAPWMWMIGPWSIYFLERAARMFRGKQLFMVKRVHHLPSQVLFLELEKKSFKYKAGQYCFLNCPYLSQYEWHPFTISSSPDEECVTFHIRCVGDWTHALSELLNPEKKKDLELGSYTLSDGKYPLIKVDGPFGAPAEEIFEYEHVMLIAAGIGVTPYASILKHIQNQLAAGKEGKLKKVYFYWVNRDSGSWEWFADIVNELEAKIRKDFLEVHTFFTGTLKLDDIRTIIFSSEEVAKHAADMAKAASARALYVYQPEASDEMELQEDDDVEVLQRNADGWWLGMNKRSGKKGLFPYNYVQVIDKVTKMEEGSRRHFGRPDWEKLFADVAAQVERVTPPREKERPRVGVFFCGPAVMSKALYTFCIDTAKKTRCVFDYKKENF